MFKLAVSIVIAVIAVMPAFGAPPSKSTPLPPSGTLFNGDYPFTTVGQTYSVPVTVPVDGAWLTGNGVWNNMSYPHWDCSHSYTATLTPNGNDYSLLFIAGWIPDRQCVQQFPVFGCLTCGVAFGGQKAYAGLYMTTNNTPGFIAAGTGMITLSSNNGGGQNDRLSFLLVEQVNRDAMVKMTIRQSVDEENPTPAIDTVVAERYFIANSGERIPVVPSFHYGTESNGSEQLYPAGPGIVWSATWDTGAEATVDVKFAPQGLHAHSILAVSIPAMPTGTHKFTVKATLPSGKTYTSQVMSVLIYAQNIYITLEGEFAPKAPVDQAPQFIPGAALNGTDIDIRTTPQMVQLNILVGGGSSGTFDVKLTNISTLPGIAMNYPIAGADASPDMDFGDGEIQKLAVPIPKGGAPKFVTIPLYIRDYAASATIEVTMPYRKTTFTTRRRIPIDKNGNGLPDAGWFALQNATTGATIHIADTSLGPTGDVDDNPSATGEPVAGRIGDGLTNLEEFRGFVVDGAYRRLNPHRKDLFILRDPLLQPLTGWILRLPLTFAFLATAEAVGDLHPMINPNRAGIAGASAQHGLRVRSRVPAPPALLGGVLIPPENFSAYGYTFSVDEDTSVMNLDDIPGLGSPNETLVVEMYPTNFGINAIDGGPDGLQTTLAAGDEPIMVDGRQAILSGSDGVLNSVLCDGVTPCNDWKTDVVSSACGANDIVLLSLAQLEDQKRSTIAHETGHGVDIEHSTENCTTSIMRVGGYLSPVDEFTPADVVQIRIHRKP